MDIGEEISRQGSSRCKGSEAAVHLGVFKEQQGDQRSWREEDQGTTGEDRILHRAQSIVLKTGMRTLAVTLNQKGSNQKVGTKE